MSCRADDHGTAPGSKGPTSAAKITPGIIFIAPVQPWCGKGPDQTLTD